MSHFSRIRDLGLWVAGGILRATEMELFDLHLSKAVNGDEGGVWAPSAVIEFGGFGLKITGAFLATGAFRVNSLGDFRLGLSVQGAPLTSAQNITTQSDISADGNIHADGTLTADSDISTHGIIHADGNIDTDGNLLADGDINATHDLNAGGDATIGGFCAVTGNISGHDIGASRDVLATRNGAFGGTMGVGGATSLGSTLAVTGITTLTGNLIANGVTRCNGGLYLPTGSAGQIDGDSTLSGIITNTGAGRTRVRVIDGDDADRSYGILDADSIHVSPSVDRIYTLVTTGAGVGDRLRFVSDTSVARVTIVGGGESGFPVKADTGFFKSVEYEFMGTTWRRALACPNDV